MQFTDPAPIDKRKILRYPLSMKTQFSKKLKPPKKLPSEHQKELRLRASAAIRGVSVEELRKLMNSPIKL